MPMILLRSLRDVKLMIWDLAPKVKKYRAKRDHGFEPHRNSRNIGFHIDYVSFYRVLYAVACPDEGRVVQSFQTETPQEIRISLLFVL